MPSKGISIHIGLNHVDPNAYNGWDGALSGCINDATDMKALAESVGFTASIITESDATADNVIAAIGSAAAELGSEDILFLTYSGHGSQVPDVNGDEDDGNDETWVLWDRQLIDDELYALWAQFEPGVRIIMLSDSCHSGTMARLLAAYTELQPAPRDGVDPVAQLRSTLAGLIPRRTPTVKPGMKVAPRPPEPERAKVMPSDVRAIVNNTHKKENAAHQYIAGDSERTRSAIGASIVLISGCQDDQLSMDGSANGLFTEKLKAVWNDGTFTGSYKEFADAIIAEMPSKQQPNYYTVGAENAAFEAQTPFRIAAPGKSPSTTTNPSPSPSPAPGEESSYPTLQRGASGAAVQRLHELLMQREFNIGADVKDHFFGPKTEGAVQALQKTYGLEISGVVDKSTWSVLM